MIRASVAMVTYNGGLYVKEQVDTILAAMSDKDELVISDDGSTDGTWELLREYEVSDNRVHLIKGPGRGVKQNVDYALHACLGQYIFLADQDDIWEPEKIEKMLKTFEEKKCGVVVHDALVVEGDGHTVLWESFYSIKNSGAGVLKNIWRNTYIGCCMAFRRELLDAVLPIPDDIEMHDEWIGIINDKKKLGTCFIPDKLIRYRRHGENASSMQHYGLKKMLSNRLVFMKEFVRRQKTWKHF